LKERVATAELFLQVFGSWYTFTHGACETDDAGRKIGGVGGVIVSANGTYLQHFGMQIPEDWMQIILQYSSPPVHELEVLSVLISFQVWFHFIRGSQVLHHTDNDSCRFPLMKELEKPLLPNALSPQSWTVNTHSNRSLGTAVCQATAILQTILAVDNSMPWLREAAKLVGILGASCCFACHPEWGRGRGVTTKAPWFEKEGVRFHHVSLILNFSDVTCCDFLVGFHLRSLFFTVYLRRRVALRIGISYMYICGYMILSWRYTYMFACS
jgi:hypothetical protein